MIWLSGGALVVCLVMIVGLIGFIFVQGAITFWPAQVVAYKLHDGKTVMGEIVQKERYQALASAESSSARAVSGAASRRIMLRTGNFDLTNEHFSWVNEADVAATSTPAWALTVERLEWGRFYGMPKSFSVDGKTVATNPAEIWKLLGAHHGEVRSRWAEETALKEDEIGRESRRVEDARLAVRELELHPQKTQAWEAKHAAAVNRFAEIEADAGRKIDAIQARVQELEKLNHRYELVLVTADGVEKPFFLEQIVRAIPTNQLGIFGKLRVYFARWWEFVSDTPREANTEGGVFPAIFGTVVMTLLMSLAVVPFGVLAALYLREYARSGLTISLVRIAINNLAGVPSIVFGVFGFGFFCYLVGSSWIDPYFFEARLPNPTYGKGAIIWASLTMALLTLPVVIVATEEALAAVPGSMREGSYACGASKWQTIRRIVLPRALPGITTGLILAMARGAGEVAPLMLVGAVKLVRDLPLDTQYPFVHPNRSFMHLGFHIFDLGFQSQNSEAAKPMVYTTTLLLVAIIAFLNITAVYVRNRLRRRFSASQF